MSSSSSSQPATDPGYTCARFHPAGRRRCRTIGIALLSATAAAAIGMAAWFATRFDITGAAAAAYAQHRYRTSLRAAQDHLKYFPSSRTALLMAARSLVRLGQTRDAETYFARSGTLDLEDLHSRAVGWLQVDEPRHALEIYREILDRWPDNALALKRAAAVRMGIKQWSEVLALSGRLIAMPAEEVAGRTLDAIAHHELKHYAQAVSASNRVLELDPDLTTMLLPRTLFWNNLALDLMALGRTEEARAHLSRALSHGDDAGLQELLGTTYSQSGDLDQAEHCWLKSVGHDPRNADAWLDLGRLAMSRRHWQRAADYLNHAADLSKDAVEPLYNLSLAHQMMGHSLDADRFRRLADERRRVAPPRGGGMGEMQGSDRSESNSRSSTLAPVR